jgi:LysR family transcriptional regulator (chromosome initiation inhibitor)
MNYIAVASRELFNAKFANGVSLDTLRDSICLAFNRKDTIQDQWMILCFDETVPVSINFVPSYEGYIACCLNGTGWGIVPKTEVINTLLKRGDLVELSPGKAVQVSLHWQTSTQSGDILNRLGEIVQEEASHQLFPDKFRTH